MLRAQFYKVLAMAELPAIHIHDLRHSTANILLSMGVNAKTVQELLGHRQISVTLGIYAHVLPSMQEDIRDKWEGFLGG